MPAVRRWFSLDLLLLWLLSVCGLSAFVLPLLVPSLQPQLNDGTGILIALLVAIVAAMLGLALQTRRLSTRLLAVLGALVAVDASLRLAVVLGLWGFSPIFFLMIAVGYSLGPGLGFGLGALTLLVSGSVSGGIGPWLPFQMLAAGWVGAGAGVMGLLLGGRVSRSRLLLLALYGALAGLLYGVFLDLWDWPLLAAPGSSSLSWMPGLPVGDLIHRFVGFYLATSILYDAFRAAGNLLLTLVFGASIITGLNRFRRRFLVSWNPNQEAVPRNMAANVRVPAAGSPASPSGG